MHFWKKIWARLKPAVQEPEITAQECQGIQKTLGATRDQLRQQISDMAALRAEAESRYKQAQARADEVESRMALIDYKAADTGLERLLQQYSFIGVDATAVFVLRVAEDGSSSQHKLRQQRHQVLCKALAHDIEDANCLTETITVINDTARRLDFTARAWTRSARDKLGVLPGMANPSADVLHAVAASERFTPSAAGFASDCQDVFGEEADQDTIVMASAEHRPGANAQDHEETTL